MADKGTKKDRQITGEEVARERQVKRTTGSKMGPQEVGERQGKGTNSSRKGDKNLQGEGNVGKKTRAFRLSGLIFGFYFCFVYLFLVKIKGGGNLGNFGKQFSHHT